VFTTIGHFPVAAAFLFCLTKSRYENGKKTVQNVLFKVDLLHVVGTDLKTIGIPRRGFSRAFRICITC